MVGDRILPRYRSQRHGVIPNRRASITAGIASLHCDRTAHASLEVSTLQAGERDRARTSEFPDQLAPLAGREARHVGPAVLHVGHHLHHGCVPTQCLRLAQDEFVAQLPFVLQHEADGLPLAHLDAIGHESHGIAHGHGDGA